MRANKILPELSLKRIMDKLTKHDENLGGFRFGEEVNTETGEVTRGYYVYDEEAGTDVLVPFKSGGSNNLVAIYYGTCPWTNGKVLYKCPRVFLNEDFATDVDGTTLTLKNKGTCRAYCMIHDLTGYAGLKEVYFDIDGEQSIIFSDTGQYRYKFADAEFIANNDNATVTAYYNTNYADQGAYLIFFVKVE